MVNATSLLPYPWERKTLPIVQEAGWPGQVQNISPLLQFDPRTIQLVVESHYTSYAILAQLLS